MTVFTFVLTDIPNIELFTFTFTSGKFSMPGTSLGLICNRDKSHVKQIKSRVKIKEKKKPTVLDL